MFKRFLPYVVVILLVVLAGIIMVSRRSGTLKQDIGDFIPPDLASVDQVDIARQNQHIVLQKTRNSWELQSIGKANSRVVNFFFTGLQRFEIVSPASKSDRREISRHLLNSGKMVTFYHHNKAIRAFYIAYDSTDIQGTYIMEAKRKLPYRIKLKGFAEVNMENLFSLNTEIWRQNSLFGYRPDEIEGIVVDYPALPGNSFRISRTSGGRYDVSGLSQKKASFIPSQEEIHDYLNYFGEIGFTRAGHSLKNHMRPEYEFAGITIMLLQGTEIQLMAYPYFPLANNPKNADKNQFIAILEQGHDTVLVKYTDMDPILRAIGDFQKK